MNTLAWPDLQYQKMKESIQTVQLWSQIVGKIRMVQMPWLNHSWNAALYISSRGLSTSAIPYAGGSFEVSFDFVSHKLVIITSRDEHEEFDLAGISVAEFYHTIFSKLGKLDIDIKIVAKPNELDPAIPFAEDEEHNTYDKEQVELYFHALLKMLPVFQEFRARFTGKCSPVHFFWGGFDLTVSRFSGRPAPLHQGAIPNMPANIMQEAYSHEVCSAGFWSGGDGAPEPFFYSYCYPVPEGFSSAKVSPEAAFYSEEMGEFLLPYKAVSSADNPEETLMQFLQSTYEAAAKAADWNREELEFSFFDME